MIRQAIPADEPAIRACAHAAFGRYVAAIGRKPPPMIADFAAQIDAGHAYVATDEGDDFLGYIVFFKQDDHMFVENIAVLPAAAGRGVGKSLISFCEDTASRLGLAEIRLYTNQKMTENLTIYPHLGYVETGRRSEYGLDRVFFQKTLSD